MAGKAKFEEIRANQELAGIPADKPSISEEAAPQLSADILAVLDSLGITEQEYRDSWKKISERRKGK